MDNKQIGELLDIAEKMAHKNAELSERNVELTDRLTAVEQRIAEGGHGSTVSAPRSMLGKMVTDSDTFKNFQNGVGNSARIELKTAIVNATGTGQPLVQGDRLRGIVHGAERRLTMRDLLTVSPTDSNLVEYAKENTFTNNAGPQVGNSPEEFENVTKPESAFSFTLETAAVTTLAHTIPVSRQVMSDSAALRNFLEQRMVYGLKLKEDTQILLGTGANGQLPGLFVNRTAYSMDSPLSYTTKLDVLRDAIGQVQASDYEPNGIVLNSADWTDICLSKDSQLRYLAGDPQTGMGAQLWGLPVVVTNSMTSGSFLVGAFDMAAELFDRQSVTVEFGYSSDQFVKNMITLLVEERIALAIYRSDALVGGSFTVS